MQRREAIAIFDQILFPANLVDVLKEDLDLAADQQTLECRVFDVHFRDVDLFHLVSLILQARERALHVGELAPHRKRKGGHRALHALQRVDAKKLHQALLAIHLPEESLAPFELGAVLRVVRLPLVRQHVTQRRIGSQVEAADLRVDLTNGRERSRKVYVRLEVDRLQPLGKPSGLRRSVVLLDVPP